MTDVIPGCHELLENRNRLLKGRKYGILCHQASVTKDLNPLVDLLIEDSLCRPTILFNPEHGLSGHAQDMENVYDSIYRGIPVRSLYGDDSSSLRPKSSDLSGLEAVVIDLADIGARYYTFAASACYMLEECAKTGIQVILCDRPNPLGGSFVEGPLLKPGFESFVGHLEIPVRHGMTLAELLHFASSCRASDADLLVLKAQNYNREMSFEQTGLIFVPPSPNMPSLTTAFVYPGACLLEATNLSEGRGTTRPFETFGAPFLDANQLAKELNGLNLPGVKFRPIQFSPSFHKFAGKSCGGCFWHVIDPQAYRPFLTGLAILKICREMAAGIFKWRKETYEFVDHIPAMDLLTGSSALRIMLEQDASLREMAESYAAEEKRFFEERKPFLIY